MKIFIKGGQVRTIYNDKTAEAMRSMGSVVIERASHVEPDDLNNGLWKVDLSPSGGEVVRGFATRGKALQFEENWLNNRKVPVPTTS